jgi:hypothetical protein
MVGPQIAMLTFVCSVGKVPLAVVLWNGGISFGGVVSFIFGDLLIIPILSIYRRHYGSRTSLCLLGVSTWRWSWPDWSSGRSSRPSG